MIPELNIYKPKTLHEILSLLDQHQNEIRIIAGGTDIVPGMQQGSARFNNFHSVIDINSIDELKSITFLENRVLIGASAKFSDIHKSEIIIKYFPVLAKAAGKIGSTQIRNLATIGGNFVNNAPCADSVPPLLIYNALLTIKSLNSERKILLKDFLLKPYKTQLLPNEIVTQIELPLISDKFIGDFYKLGRRRAVSISRITIAVLIDIEDEKIKELRLASGAVTPIGKRLIKIEEYAKGKTADKVLFRELSRMVGREILSETGFRWSSQYKLPVVQQMVFQLFMSLYSEAKESKSK